MFLPFVSLEPFILFCFHIYYVLLAVLSFLTYLWLIFLFKLLPFIKLKTYQLDKIITLSFSKSAVEGMEHCVAERLKNALLATVVVYNYSLEIHQ